MYMWRNFQSQGIQTPYLQRSFCENLKMKEQENIVEYLLRVDEIVNSIRGIGGEIKEKEVVDKVLRTHPMKYDSKVSSLEELDDIKLMTIDELHGIFTSYEMITWKNESSNKRSF